MTSLFALVALLAAPPAAPAAADAPAADAPAEAAPAEAAPAAPAPTEAQAKAAAEAWGTVYEVLMHPRCMNCHPAGDRPLQTDASVPHAQNISRLSEKNGLACATCHQEQNSEAYGVKGGPPGAPHWGLPAEDMPLIFQNRSPSALCEQLKRPADNGNRTLADLLHHVTHDKLVLWGWEPGGDRAPVSVPHDRFVAAMKTWVDGGGACPPAPGQKTK